MRWAACAGRSAARSSPATWVLTPAPRPATTSAATAASFAPPAAACSESTGSWLDQPSPEPPRRPRSSSGNGNSAATFSIARSRIGRRATSAASTPAATAWRRQGWQWATWRARRRVSRAPRRPLDGGRDDRLDAQAALAGGELVVLLGQPPAGAEERALDGRAAHAHPLADLAVGEALELAQDEDLVVGVRQAAERAAQVVELLLGGDRDVRHRLGGDEAAVVGGREALVGVEGDLLGALGAAELVDAGVLGDLVDPRLERDRALGLAHAAQRGDEDLLRDVLRALVVLDHPVHVRVDAAVVALVERLEGAVVAAAHLSDQLVVADGAVRLEVAADWRLQQRAHVPLPTIGDPSCASAMMTRLPASPLKARRETLAFT